MFMPDVVSHTCYPNTKTRHQMFETVCGGRRQPEQHNKSLSLNSNNNKVPNDDDHSLLLRYYIFGFGNGIKVIHKISLPVSPK